MAVNVPTKDSLELAAQNVSALKQVFYTINADSCPRSFNFHMHTTSSDGKLKPEELMEQALSIGLKGLAITDHHSVGGYQVARKWLEYRQQDLNSSVGKFLPHLWTGVEITSKLLGTEVHILGYAFNPASSHIQAYLQGERPKGDDADAVNVIAAIHQAGGLAVLAHPVRYGRSPVELIAEAACLGIDGVETYYAYGNPNPWRPSPQQTEQVEKLTASYGLLNTCGTDTHGVNLLMRL